MGTRKSTGLLFIATIACIGCCAIPISGIIAGATSLGFAATIMNQKSLDIMLCAVPLVLIALCFYIYQRKNRCCSSPEIECSDTQCSTRDKTPLNRE